MVSLTYKDLEQEEYEDIMLLSAVTTFGGLFLPLILRGPCRTSLSGEQELLSGVYVQIFY